MDAPLNVTTTVPDRALADRLTRCLLEARLAASVQVIGPMDSTYWWRDRIEQAREWLCLIKTRRAVLAPLTAMIRELHPYEVPEIYAVPIEAGTPEYQAWIDRYTGDPTEGAVS
ncbi:MAG: divalent-cation tolerance protein CutA [Acidobacteriota bacterium]|nr:divalent-cation tolerance protein CutA [Acidobacteriota bacterium]